VEEPMIADPDVNNADVLKDIRMIRLDHFLLRRSEKVDLGFVGSCMVHKGFKNSFEMLQNIDEQYGSRV
jgi:aconitate hydratase 2/2-methylisocitrate dehydratase